MRGLIGFLTGSTVLTTLLSTPASASIDPYVNFDDISVGGSGIAFLARDRYVSEGVLFNRDIPVCSVAAVEPSFLPVFISGGGTPPNSMPLTPAIPGAGLEIEVSFVLPGTTIPGTTDYVRLDGFDSDIGTVIGTLQAYDRNSLLLDQITLPTLASRHGLFEISHVDIASIHISTDADGAHFDNLAFHTPVPEPASLSLFALAAAGLLARRRTRNK
jgi:hypothetical protein